MTIEEVAQKIVGYDYTEKEILEKFHLDIKAVELVEELEKLGIEKCPICGTWCEDGEILEGECCLYCQDRPPSCLVKRTGPFTTI